MALRSFDLMKCITKCNSYASLCNGIINNRLIHPRRFHTDTPFNHKSVYYGLDSSTSYNSNHAWSSIKFSFHSSAQGVMHRLDRNLSSNLHGMGPISIANKLDRCFKVTPAHSKDSGRYVVCRTVCSCATITSRKVAMKTADHSRVIYGQRNRSYSDVGGNDDKHNKSLMESESLYNQWWLIKLANENGYLSWIRNTYISGVLGATVYPQDMIPYAKEVANLLLCISCANIIFGTMSYSLNIFKLRRKELLSSMVSLILVFGASLHALLWLAAVTIYLGYVEEEDTDEIHRHVDSIQDVKDRENILNMLRDMSKKNKKDD